MLLLSLRQSWREAKAGPLAGIFWALVITIAVLTAVNTASDRARQALSMTASELLAADLVLSSRQPLAADYQQQAQAVGLATANTVTFNTVVFADTASSLVAAKAVSPEYPLRGSLRAARQRYSMGETTASGPANGEVWAEQRLFEQLNVDIGSMLQVGDQRYRLSRVLTLEPDRSGGFAGLSPRLLLSMHDARQAGLLRSQSRATWRLLLAGDKQVLRDLAEAVRKDPAISVSTPERAQAQSADAIAQTRSFLSIAALSAVFLGAAGMLLAMHQYRLRERQNVALWRSFGIAWPRIRLLMILRLFWLTMVAAVLGVLAGLLLQGVLSTQLGALLQINLPAVRMTPLLSSFVMASVLAAGLCLPPLLQLRLESPMNIFRVSGQSDWRQLLRRYTPALIGLALISWWQLRDWQLTLWLVLILLLLLLSMSAAAAALLWLLGRQQHSGGAVWRLVISSLLRHRHGNALHMAAISLALLALLLLGWLRNDMLDQWQGALQPGTPNHFMINIQPAQKPAVQQLLADYQVEQLDFGPMAIARISQINGVAAADWRPQADPPGRRDGTVNLSWRDKLPQTNRIVKGQWFSADDPGLQISLSEDWARELDLQPGDSMTFSVGSETRTGTITSLRAVDWDSFRINFFILINPAAAADLDFQYVANFYLPPGSNAYDQQHTGTSLLRALSSSFPNITVYDTNALIARVSELFSQLTRALDSLFWFTLAAALVVMLITIQTGQQIRKHEIALLRCMGVDRRTLYRAWFLEQCLIGLIIGVLTALTAAVATWWISTRMLQIEWQWQWDLLLLALLSAGLGVPLVNWLFSRGVVQTPPLRILQSA